MHRNAGRTLARAVVALAAAAGAVAGAAAPAAHAAAVTGCPWTEFTRLPLVSTFPDRNTQIYQCVYSAGPLHQTVIEGRPPHARFWSIAVLDQARREIASLPDDRVALQADGTYRIVVRQRCGATPNCLDIDGAMAPLLPGLVYYRVYVPTGDARGGVPLPTVRYESIAPTPGDPVDLSAATDALSAYVDAATAPLGPDGLLGRVLAGPSGLDRPVPPDAVGADPPVTRFHALGAKQLETLRGAGVPDAAIDAILGVLGQGGFGATRDNAYATVNYDTTQGNLVLRAKAPTYRAQSPAPRNDAGRTDGSEQVRYWSVCTTQATRTVDCVRDELVPLDADGLFDVVIAPSCPVAGHATCLRAGALGAAGPAAVGTLVYRNTTAAPSFYDDDGPTVCPSDDVMYCGPYAPRGHYEARP